MIGCVTQQGLEESNKAAAAKAFADRGATAGPDEPMFPGRALDPESIDRPYISAGHAAISPGNCPPNAEPDRVRPSWRAGVAGDGPAAVSVRDWQAGIRPLPGVPEGSS